MSEPVAPLIRLEGIEKFFGPVHANRNISLDIHAGRIKALLGENGAGKSTLMGILAGHLRPDGGQICLEGRPVTFSSTKAAIAAGIGMVYQHFMLVDAMTVAENVLMGQEPGFWLQPKQMVAQVGKLAENYGLGIDPAARVADLSMGERQRVEILKLLLRRSRVLIFDEPTAVLTPEESEQLFDALREMARQGKAILFISHKLGEVMRLADEIAILRRGQIVDELATEQVASTGELARRMVGKEVLLEIDREPMEAKQMVLQIDRLSCAGLQEVSLTLRQGEILAIVGVAGNGQKPLAETICGLRAPEGGTIKILGRSWEQYHLQRRREGALSYIPEDRRGLATCLGLDLVDNFLLTTHRRFCRGPWIQRKQAGEKTGELIDSFTIYPPNAAALARQLSGGNLQKLVLAREFYRRPQLIVAEQPTQGLDIAATEEVWSLLLNARERAGILLISGDLNEALSLADRIAVMFAGRIVETFPASDRERVDRIGPMMAGIRSGDGAS